MTTDSSAGAGKPTYSAGSYWDSRYTGPAKNFDWFYNYPALKEFLHVYLPSGKVLHVGCGNSNIQEGMAADGFTVTNVDISPVVIEQMKHQHADNHLLDYLVADCRDMSGLESCSFQSCIDKGTLDAVLCSQSGQGDAVQYLHEVGRLLQPGGIFLLISLGAPAARLTLLQKEAWGTVEVLLLPKPLLYLQSEATASGRPLPAHVAADKNQPIAALGPWPAEQAVGQLAELQLDARDYFFAYLCRKHQPQQAAAGPAPTEQEQGEAQGREQSEGQGAEQQQQQPQQPEPQQQQAALGEEGQEQAAAEEGRGQSQATQDSPPRHPPLPPPEATAAAAAAPPGLLGAGPGTGGLLEEERAGLQQEQQQQQGHQSSAQGGADEEPAAPGSPPSGVQERATGRLAAPLLVSVPVAAQVTEILV